MEDKINDSWLEINSGGALPVMSISENLVSNRIWFTADSHFMHRNIIRLCNRPYSTLEAMEEDMVRRWNLVVKEKDLVFFLGDFSMNMIAHKIFFPKLVFGKMVFIVGNHEKKNKLMANILSLNMSEKISVFNDLILRYKDLSFFLTHRPINARLDMPTLCGHVHEKWKYMGLGSIISEGAPESRSFKSIKLRAPVLNVGVDQFDFCPVSLNSILAEFDFKDDVSC